MRSFPSWTIALPILLLAAQIPEARAEPLNFKSDVTLKQFTATIGGELSFPPGRGPFPVVIFMHACGGLDRVVKSSLQAHGRNMTKAGFATYVLDSFGARNLNGGKVCDPGALHANAVSFRRDDAVNAMAALRKHPRISKENIFLVGQSHGAAVALLAALALTDHDAFRAIAAFYTSCGVLYNSSKLKSPIIVFAGGKDDWTPPYTCTHAKSIDRFPGAEFELVIYPNAFHSFDLPLGTIKYKGHVLAYDQQATADSQKKMKEFFIRHLTDELKALPPFAGSVRKR